MAIKHKVKTAKFGVDNLGIFYKRIPFEERKYLLREIAHKGASFIRIFNCDKDNMKFEDYNDSYWKQLEENLKLCFYEVAGKQMIIPILSLGGYWRVNKKKLTQTQWEIVFEKAIDIGIKVMGKKNLMVEIVNEPFTYTPAGFPRTTPTTMHNKMFDIGSWHVHMVQLCLSKGLKIGQIMVNVIDVPDKGDPEIKNDIYYPKNAKNADMILGLIGKIKPRKDMIASYHRIHFPKDIKSQYGAWRVFVTTISRFWHFTNDGGSATNEVGHGADPSPLLTGGYKTIDKKELADIAHASFILARDGIRKSSKMTHKIMVWYADLGRDGYIWDVTWYCKKCDYKKVVKGLSPKDKRPDIPKCPICGNKIYHSFKLVNTIKGFDFDRIDVMEHEYYKVFGKHSANWGKFPEPVKPKPEPKPPKPKPVEPIKPKPKKEVKTMREKLNEVWWKLLRFHFAGFWENSVWEQKVSAVFILMILILFIWGLIRIF